MADILDEVLNEAKDEKKILLFYKLLPITIIVTVIIVIAMSINGWYQNNKELRNQQLSDKLLNLSHNSLTDLNATNASLEKLISNNKQSEIIELQIVHNLITSNELLNAKKKLESIIKNTKYDNVISSYSRILWMNIILDQKNISGQEQEKLLGFMEFFNDKDQCFWGIATLYKAIFYQKNQKLDLSKDYANQIIEWNNASLTLKEHAQAILSNIKRK